MIILVFSGWDKLITSWTLVIYLQKVIDMHIAYRSYQLYLTWFSKVALAATHILFKNIELNTILISKLSELRFTLISSWVHRHIFQKPMYSHFINFFLVIYQTEFIAGILKVIFNFAQLSNGVGLTVVAYLEFFLEVRWRQFRFTNWWVYAPKLHLPSFNLPLPSYITKYILYIIHIYKIL